jgi:hypothetical protein
VVLRLFFFFSVRDSSVLHMGMVPEDTCRAGESEVPGEISSGGSLRRVSGEVWCSGESPATLLLFLFESNEAKAGVFVATKQSLNEPR